MKELIGKFIELEQKISVAKGDFTFFALFLREDAPDKWDLLVAAPWIELGKREALLFIAQHLQTAFQPEELTQLSRIVLVELDNPALQAITQNLDVTRAVIDVNESNLFGLQIKQAVIITSHNPDVKIPVSVG